MVGRLVEEQQLRLAEKYLCQLHTHLPAVAELIHGTGHVLMVEAETHEDLLRLAFYGMSAYECQPLVECAHTLTKLLVAITFIISALRELILQLGQFFLNLMIFLECRHRLFEDCLFGIYVLFLWEVAYCDVIRHHNVTV